MNTESINKDNTGSTVLLAAMLITIAAAIFGSVSADAKEDNIALSANAAATLMTAPVVETFVVTAPRLK
jgi:hypothetical protein